MSKSIRKEDMLDPWDATLLAWDCLDSADRRFAICYLAYNGTLRDVMQKVAHQATRKRPDGLDIGGLAC